MRPGAGGVPTGAVASQTGTASAGAAYLRPRGSHRPDWLLLALGLMVVTYVWRFQQLFPWLGQVRITMLCGLLAFGLWLADRDRHRAIAHLRSPLLRVLLGIFGLVVVSTPFSVYVHESFDFLVKDYALTFIFMVMVASSIRSLHDVEWLILTFMVGAMTYTSVSLIEGAGKERLAGAGYYDANDFALLLVCAVPFAVYFLRGQVSRRRRLAATLGLILFVVALMRTVSRGGFLGFIAVGFYILFHFRALSRFSRWGAVVGGAAILAIGASDAYWERISTILNPEQDYNLSESNPSGRMEIWKRGLGYMLSSPVGVGPFAFPHAEGRSEISLHREELGIGFKWSAAHNSFVQIGAELGVVGLVLFVAAFWICVRQLRRLASSHDPPAAGLENSTAAMAQALIAALIGFIVAGSFVSFAYSALIYFLFGITLGLLKLHPETSSTRAAARPFRASARAPLPR